MFDRGILMVTVVLAALRDYPKNPDEYGFSKVTLLRGNHEDLLIKAIENGPV